MFLSHYIHKTTMNCFNTLAPFEIEHLSQESPLVNHSSETLRNLRPHSCFGIIGHSSSQLSGRANPPQLNPGEKKKTCFRQLRGSLNLLPILSLCLGSSRTNSGSDKDRETLDRPIGIAAYSRATRSTILPG